MPSGRVFNEDLVCQACFTANLENNVITNFYSRKLKALVAKMTTQHHPQGGRMRLFFRKSNGNTRNTGLVISMDTKFHQKLFETLELL